MGWTITKITAHSNPAVLIMVVCVHKSMPTQEAISLPGHRAFSDKYVQNSYQALGLIDIIIAIGSIKRYPSCRYIWFLIKDFLLFSQWRYFININNDLIDPSD